MAKTPPTTDARNANLDALKIAMGEWFEIEKKRLENETKFLQAVLLDRGASNAGTLNLATESALLQSEVDDFIVGG